MSASGAATAGARSRRQRLQASVAAELHGMLRGRRQGWALAAAIGASALGGLATGGVASQLGGVGSGELGTAIVSRGAATLLAVTLLAALGIAAPYRDGAWLHAALAEPRPSARLLASAIPMLGASLALGVIAAVSAGVGAALAVSVDLGALALASCLHLAVTMLWSVWMLGLAHASRSPMLTLGVGVGMPVALEPAIAGLVSQAQVDVLRWALPGQALRALGELSSSGAALLLPVPPTGLAIAVATVVLCTAAAVFGAWLRMRGAQPR